MNLTDQDLESLEKGFLTRAIVQEAALKRVSDMEGAEIVGRKYTANVSYAGIVIPYFLPPDYSKARQYRLRRDLPDYENEKEKNKYLSHGYSRNEIYFPPKVTETFLRDADLPIVITEGEKKALSLYRVATENLSRSRWDFLPIALSGVWNFRGKIGKIVNANGKRVDNKGVISDFDLFNWEKRIVYIVFDKNTLTNQSVFIARYQLADHLARSGAIVKLVNLPQVENINGIDDLLGLWEHEAGEKTAFERFSDLLGKANRFAFNAVFSRSLVEGHLLFKIEPDARNKARVSAFNYQGKLFQMDSLNVADAEKRTKFVKNLIEPTVSLSPDQKAEVNAELIRIFDVLKEIVQDVEPAKESETVETSFAELADGRIIEQVRGGFALYNPADDSFGVVDSVTDSDGTTYKPIDDQLFQKDLGGLYLADGLIDYKDENELDADIEAYLSRFLDLKPFPLKLAAKYIRFTYLFDKFLEIAYLNPTGEPGNGKSRFGLAVVLACRRGFISIDPTSANLYRIIDEFQPTMFIDEFNTNHTTDAANIVQILNAGMSKLNSVQRQAATGDGKFKTENFSPFCPKIIGSIKQSESNALNSRNIEIQMERTDRNDIPLRLSPKMIGQSQILRNKLTLYRLRNYKADLETELDAAEMELKKAGIIPRSIQISIVLFALIKNRQDKDQYIALLQNRDKVLIEEKQHTFDGELVRTIHELLFEISEDGVKPHYYLQPKDGEVCDLLKIEQITDKINGNITANLNGSPIVPPNKSKQVDHRYVGKKISKTLGLKTEIVNTRGLNYKKRLVVFDSARLALIFKNYGFPIPDGFLVRTCSQDDKHKIDNDLTCEQEKKRELGENITCSQSNLNNNSTYGNANKCEQEKTENPLNGKTKEQYCRLCLTVLVEQENSLRCPQCEASGISVKNSVL